MRVYQAINAVQRELAAAGISKDRRNQQQGYNFRGIDDVFNALSPLLGKHGLCVLPRVVERSAVERQTQKGGLLFFVTVGVEFDFISAEDGSKHVVKTYGEAMDSADKATNKAMSAAYKYAALQAFAIPTEGDDNDPDASHHPDWAEAPSQPRPAPRPAPRSESAPQPAGNPAEMASQGEINWAKAKIGKLDAEAGLALLAKHGIKGLDSGVTKTAFLALKADLLKA